MDLRHKIHMYHLVVHLTNLVSGAPSLTSHGWAAGRTGLKDELGLMRRLLALPFKTRCCGARLTGTPWDGGTMGKIRKCLIPPRHPGQHPPGPGRRKNDPACTEICCLPTGCVEVSQKAVAFVWGLVFFLASQQSSLKILLRNDSLESSSGFILQGADAAAGCQAALIPGSFPTPTGCRAQNNRVTVTNEHGCLSLWRSLGREGLQRNNSLLYCSSLPGKNAFYGFANWGAWEPDLYSRANPSPGLSYTQLQQAQKSTLMQTEKPRISWPNSAFFACAGRHRLPQMQQSIRSCSCGSPAHASDFVYVNKCRNVTHLCRQDQRKKLVSLVSLAQFVPFWDCVLF